MIGKTQQFTSTISHETYEFVFNEYGKVAIRNLTRCFKTLGLNEWLERNSYGTGMFEWHIGQNGWFQFPVDFQQYIQSFADNKAFW